jgi:hypothetical protein
MQRALLVLVVLAASALCCGRPEWAVPRSGGGACMCSLVCACGMTQNEESQRERERCFDACSCDRCPGEHVEKSEKSEKNEKSETSSPK